MSINGRQESSTSSDAHVASHGRTAVYHPAGVSEAGIHSDPSRTATHQPADHSGATETQPNGPTVVASPPAPYTVPGFEVYRQLGEGGMGVVYLARQLSLDRLVALKTLRTRDGTETAHARVRQEAAVLAKLSHPNVVQVYEVGEAEGRTYFALELVPGGSLDDRLRASPLAPRSAASIVRTLTAALEATHRVGIIHCDLKPANVLLAIDGTPKVADFGLARRFDTEDLATRTGSVCGTPSYMAPEQAAGRLRDFGPAVDVYALGGILYALLTGRPPFLADNILDTLRQVEEQEPVSPRRLNPAVPVDLETICLKCLDKRPARRYPSAAALGDDLSRFLESRPVSARRTGWMEQVGRWAIRHPSRAALIVVCGLTGCGAVGAGAWVMQRLDADLARTEDARDATQVALVNQAADRLDGELRELAAVPRLIAKALEAGESVTTEWLTKLVEGDSRVFGICVARETMAGPATAELAQRNGHGVTVRQLDREADTLVRDQDWYVRGRDSGSCWTVPYHGTDAARTWMVSYIVPFRKNGQFAGVVVLDVAVTSFEVVRATLGDLIPGVDDECRLLTHDGQTLFESSHTNAGIQLLERTATVSSTGWRLVVMIRNSRQGSHGATPR